MSKKISVILIASLLTAAAHAEGFCEKYDCIGYANNLITEDSRSWFFNRYDRNSVKINDVWESPSGIKVKVKVDYTYNGGISGWAELRFNDGEFQCIRYHDFPNDCRSGPKF